MVIYVDADATPRQVLRVTRALAAKYDIPVITISSINHEIRGDHHIQVDAASQATDMEIIRRIESSVPTIVITQDYGLAALVLARKAFAISPSGLLYTNENIDQLLYERAASAKLRRGGKVRMRGPRPRTQEDDEKFAQELRNLIESLLHP
ncbi:YaiI/YqxD family protein [Alicyclobacillus acidoterrestris]|uniref:YaiI/YqxD family protein n=1 Tax=Alicyclobacillus acidoterrestris TaxID=1450 RepID=UPI003F52DEF2